MTDELSGEIFRARIVMPLGAQDTIKQYEEINASLNQRIKFLEALPLHSTSMKVLRYQTKVRLWKWLLRNPDHLRRRVAKRIYDWEYD